MTTKISFRLAAEQVGGASEGILLGDFNNWEPVQGIQLQKQEDGSLHTEIELIGGQSYQYRYLLSDGRWVNDAQAGTTFTEVYGQWVENNIVSVPATEWSQVATEKKSAPKNSTKKAVAKKEKPVADDLTRIEGIGKKIAALLKKKDIITYKALAKSSIKNLKAILDEAGPKYNVHNPTSWPKQAKLAAAAKWDELDALQKELIGGK